MAIESPEVPTGIENVPDLSASEITTACPTCLIEDIPSEKDQFASSVGIGPHDRVARAIADMIVSPTESGGKMIGLEGDWGAGKTTVINLIKKRLAANDKITIYSYDAWAHEGDPLRRTFLESLIRHFQSIGEDGWIDKADSDKEIENLAHRREVSNTRTIPKVTTLGKAFALSAILVPFSSPLLTAALRQEITIDTGYKFSWTFFFGIIFGLAPVIVALANAILIKYRKTQKNKALTKESRPLNSEKDKTDDWAFIGSHSITENNQETIKTPQPTSIEFQNVFCKILEEALQGKPDRKIVMVLDNLDRVDAKDALSIWSTLQTFLQCRNDRTDDWFRKLWIVIPYDPEGLRQLWENRGAGIGVSSDIGTQDVPESFLDKSFQLRFRVAPPLLLNWKVYLEMLIMEALPLHTHEEAYKIYQVFRQASGKGIIAPTPRELKLFVNQIGTVHRQWQHEFPLDHIAYYTILCRNRVKIREKLLSENLDAVQSMLSPNLVANLAGLTFNVTATLGQQLLLAEPITNALGKGDVVQLKKLEETNHAGFWVVLESVMTEKGVGETATEIANAAHCIAESQLLDNQSRSERDAIVTALKNSALRIEAWTPFNGSVADGIAAVCRLVSVPWFSEKMMKSLRETFANPSFKPGAPVVKDTIHALIRVFEEIKKIDNSFTVNRFPLLLNEHGWFAVSQHILELDEQYWTLFTPQSDIKDGISSLLENIVSTGKFSAVEIDALKVTSLTMTNCDWPFVAKTLGDRLLATQEATTNETISLLQGLSFLKGVGNPQAKEALEQLAVNGHLMHKLHQAHTQKDDVCTARLLVAILEERPKADKPAAVGNSDAGYSILNQLLATDNHILAKQMVDILGADDNLNLLIEIVDGRGAYDQLIVACLRLVAASDDPEVVFSPDVVVSRWSDLWDHLNKDEDGDLFDELIGKLCVNSSLQDVVQNREGGFDYQDAWLYMRICMVCSSQSFSGWCCTGLESLSSGVWEKQFNIGGNVLDLLWYLVDAETKVTLKQPFQDALVNHAKGILAGGTVPEDEHLTQWPKLLDSLGDAPSRKILGRRLLSEFVGKEGVAADAFLQVYGAEILKDASVLYEEKDLIAKLFSPLLRKRNVPGLTWLKSVFENYPDLLLKSKDRDAAEDFVERIQGELGKPVEDADQIHELIAGIATNLGISIEIAKDEEVSAVEEQ